MLLKSVAPANERFINMGRHVNADCPNHQILETLNTKLQIVLNTSYGNALGGGADPRDFADKMSVEVL